MDEIKKQVIELKHQVKQATESLKIEDLAKELDKLQAQMASPDFWQDPVAAKEISMREASLKKRTEPWQSLSRQLKELDELSSLGDDSMRNELQKQVDEISTRLQELKQDLKFQGPYDDHDVVLNIYSGAGGTDAQDWAQILLRMYLRWGESHGLTVKTIDQTSGEEAGIKSATVELSGGSFLYGKLAGEHGVHRLVRLSPFNSDNLRQTSFAKVEVLPMISSPSELQIDEKDLKIDVYRAGGHGGQSVNTTDSAVRVTHTPTGITVAIQNERSQLQNKETALAILRSRLVALQLEQHADTVQQLKGPKQSADWGNQIRSYVLHPYKQVKDLRTGYETSDSEKILNGDLDPLIEAWLEYSISG